MVPFRRPSSRLLWISRAFDDLHWGQSNFVHILTQLHPITGLRGTGTMQAASIASQTSKARVTRLLYDYNKPSI
jgi:hypothetical protein